MKIKLLASVAALVCLASFTPRAGAWCDWKFGVGLNLAYKGGGNNFLWGAKKSEQPPAGAYPGYPAVPYPAPLGGPVPMPIGTDPNYPATGSNPNSAAPAAAAAMPPYNTQPVAYWNGQAGYQPLNYYPSYGYGYANYQNPSAWYGR